MLQLHVECDTSHMLMLKKKVTENGKRIARIYCGIKFKTKMYIYKSNIY